MWDLVYVDLVTSWDLYIRSVDAVPTLYAMNGVVRIQRVTARMSHSRDGVLPIQRGNTVVPQRVTLYMSNDPSVATNLSYCTYCKGFQWPWCLDLPTMVPGIWLDSKARGYTLGRNKSMYNSSLDGIYLLRFPFPAIRVDIVVSEAWYTDWLVALRPLPIINNAIHLMGTPGISWHSF